MIFDGGRTFDDSRADLENALSMTRLTARSDHERVGAVNIMGLIAQSDSTTLEQGMQHDMSKKNTPGRAKGLAKEGSKEQMLSGGSGPVAGPLFANDRCLELHRNLQVPTKSYQPPARSKANGGIV